ncbi:MAG: hypothetical protein EOO89_09940 [Pedobacter sp.]|nr:MAG: hypothetical protein EOO89_09940 [Pedobacter sp.]
MMKFFTFLLLLLSAFAASAQRKLTESAVSGKYTYIYSITDKEASTIIEGGVKVVTDQFLKKKTDSFVNEADYKKQLPHGYYIYAKPVKEKLEYKLKLFSAIDSKVINNGRDLRVFISDLNGDPVQNAEVRVGNIKAKFDAASFLYVAPYPAERVIISIKYNGKYNYVATEPVDIKYNYKTNDYPTPAEVYKPPVYKGYMVFSKPKYRPGDTVKFKAFVVLADGSAIKNVPVNVNLIGQGFKKEINKIVPYRDGGYEHSFVLKDSLGLKLDRTYMIDLVEIGGSWKSLVSGSFQFSDYELTSLEFFARSDNKDHTPGAKTTVYMKATDENGLPVADGRVNITVKRSYVEKWKPGYSFIPDTMLRTTLKLDPVGETKFVLPDSIFKALSMSFKVDLELLNSNNEKRNRSLSFSHSLVKTKKGEIADQLKDGYLHLEYYEDSLSKPYPVQIITHYQNNLPPTL